MKKKIPVRKDEKRREAATGRKHDLGAKAAFKNGAVARTDKNAGRAKPLLPLHQVGRTAVQPGTYTKEDIA